jgi:hypothetical protein
MSASVMNKVSKTSKLGTFSWSLQAVETCPGAVGADGKLVDACSGCYATAGCYNFPDTKKVRADNKLAWQEADWVEVMTGKLKKQTHFRFFDSGDMYSIGLANKIFELAVALPSTKFWIPTRMHKFAKFADIISKLNSLPNVTVRPSSDNVDGTYTAGVHGSTILPTAEVADSNTFVCSAPSQGGKCLDCRACYDKSIPVIGYIAHGKKMAKVIRIATA